MVHAGPSQPLVLLKDLTSLKMENSSVSLNNNSLIAQNHTETKVAMVVSWTMPSNMSKNSVSPLKANILIKEPMVPVPILPLCPPSKTPDIMMSLLTTQLNYKPLLLKDPSQLPLKPINSVSNSTVEVSLMTLAAEPH